MKLATIKNETTDGRLIVVSLDGTRYLSAGNYQTLQQVIENWAKAIFDLTPVVEELIAGAGDSTAGLDFSAPLPRALAMA